MSDIMYSHLMGFRLEMRHAIEYGVWMAPEPVSHDRTLPWEYLGGVDVIIDGEGTIKHWDNIEDWIKEYASRELKDVQPKYPDDPKRPDHTGTKDGVEYCVIMTYIPPQHWGAIGDYVKPSQRAESAESIAETERIDHQNEKRGDQ